MRIYSHLIPALVCTLFIGFFTSTEAFAGSASFGFSDDDKTAVCRKQYNTCLSQCPAAPHSARLVCFQQCANQHTRCLNLIRAEYGLEPFPVPYPKVD
ncbi:MAG: hypothetical protein AB7L92_05775 [Alphaproteobacteria bacterium]